VAVLKKNVEVEWNYYKQLGTFVSVLIYIKFTDRKTKECWVNNAKKIAVKVKICPYTL
jgi:hypothetical protein